MRLLRFTIMLTFALAVFANVYEDKPIYIFVDSDYTCTPKQLKHASDHFKKCEGTPEFRSCYAESIMEHCSKRWWF